MWSFGRKRKVLCKECGGSEVDDRDMLCHDCSLIMKCPKDGTSMVAKEMSGINGHVCPKCELVVLEKEAVNDIVAMAVNKGGNAAVRVMKFLLGIC